MPPDTSTKAFTFADAAFAECQLVHDFIGQHVRPVAQRFADTGAESQTVLALLARVHGWLRTLRKLNHPGDFQGMVAGARALFELAVDFSLLVHDPMASVNKLLAWERSAKLDAAEKLVAFAQDHQVDLDVSTHEGFISRERAQVQADRQAHWRRPKHPMRWTGRWLPDDARESDWRASTRFEQYYRERFAQLCWSTHGSGIAGVRYVTEDLFPAIGGQALHDAAGFGLHCCRDALRYLDQYDDIARVRFEHIEASIVRVTGQILSRGPDSGA